MRAVIRAISIRAQPQSGLRHGHGSAADDHRVQRRAAGDCLRKKSEHLSQSRKHPPSAVREATPTESLEDFLTSKVRDGHTERLQPCP